MAPDAYEVETRAAAGSRPAPASFERAKQSSPSQGVGDPAFAPRRTLRLQHAALGNSVGVSDGKRGPLRDGWIASLRSQLTSQGKFAPDCNQSPFAPPACPASRRHASGDRSRISRPTTSHAASSRSRAFRRQAFAQLEAFAAHAEHEGRRGRAPSERAKTSSTASGESAWVE